MSSPTCEWSNERRILVGCLSELFQHCAWRSGMATTRFGLVPNSSRLSASLQRERAARPQALHAHFFTLLARQADGFPALLTVSRRLPEPLTGARRIYCPHNPRAARVAPPSIFASQGSESLCSPPPASAPPTASTSATPNAIARASSIHLNRRYSSAARA